MKILLITSQYPRPDAPFAGIFIKRQVDGLREAGVDVDVVAYHGAKNPLNYARAWWQIRKQLRATNYDLIHAQFGNSGILALPKCLPLVVTYQGSDVYGIFKDERYTVMGRILQAISRFVAHYADEAMIVSPRMHGYLPQREYTVLPSGVDRRLFHPMPQEKARQHLRMTDNNPKVFFAANPHNPVKRFALAHEAVEIVRQTLPNVELVKAGNIAVDDMPYYHNACDALLLTSAHEGSPNVVKEALCCNLPIVSVDVGDVRERLQGVDGCEVVDDSPHTLADALLNVLQKRQRLQADAIAEQLSAEYEVKRVIEVYERAIGKH